MAYDTITSVTDDVNDNLAQYQTEKKTAIEHVMSSVPYAAYGTPASMTGNVVLTDADFPVLSYSPTAARDLTLPALATTNHPFYVINRSATYAITVKDAAAATITTVGVSSAALIVSDGANNWYAFSGGGGVKATGAELDTGTDDAKFATAKALKDSHNVPSVAPSAAGNIIQTLDGIDYSSVPDILPNGVGKGLIARNINRLGISTFTDHFQSGTIPSGYAWDTGALFGGTPVVLSYNYLNDYMNVADADKCFLKKAVTNDSASWAGKGIWTRAMARKDALAGVRIDDGNDAADRPFFEVYLLNASGMQTLTVRYRTTVAGGITTNSYSTLPAGDLFTFGILCHSNGTDIYSQIVGETGAFLLEAITVAWMPAAGRAGLFSENPAFGTQHDWFYSTFT